MIEAYKTVYSIDFRIKKGTTHPQCNGFTINGLVTDSYKGSMYYKTKNEAIDVLIETLEKFKDKDE